jgi:hypothetical protein
VEEEYKYRLGAQNATMSHFRGSGPARAVPGCNAARNSKAPLCNAYTNASVPLRKRIEYSMKSLLAKTVVQVILVQMGIRDWL